MKKEKKLNLTMLFALTMGLCALVSLRTHAEIMSPLTKNGASIAFLGDSITARGASAFGYAKRKAADETRAAEAGGTAEKTTTRETAKH